MKNSHPNYNEPVLCFGTFADLENPIWFIGYADKFGSEIHYYAINVAKFDNDIDYAPDYRAFVEEWFPLPDFITKPIPAENPAI